MFNLKIDKISIVFFFEILKDNFENLKYQETSNCFDNHIKKRSAII